MRGLVINYVRDRKAIKRGGDLTFTTLDDLMAPADLGPDLAAIGAALDELAVVEPARAVMVGGDGFGGPTVI